LIVIGLNKTQGLKFGRKDFIKRTWSLKLFFAAVSATNNTVMCAIVQ
jgi:hypothetical protein